MIYINLLMVILMAFCAGINIRGEKFGWFWVDIFAMALNLVPVIALMVFA
jgi:hypothetical protein